MKRNIITAAIVSAAALIATGASAANLVTNGDFDNIGGVWSDNSGLGSNDFKTTGGVAIPGWSNVTGFANEFWVRTPNLYSGLTASPGNGSIYFVDLTGQANSQPFGGLEQTISTTPGVSYTLTFALGDDVELGPHGWLGVNGERDRNIAPCLGAFYRKHAGDAQSVADRNALVHG
jgi:hypothetical protein